MRQRALRTVATWLLVCLAFAPVRALAQGGLHVVGPGDTLSALALRYGTTVGELKERNGLSDDAIRVGQVLTLPGPDGWRTERAPSGADWDSLARTWDLPAELLRAANPGIGTPAGRDVRIPPDVGRLATPSDGEDLVAFAARLGIPPGALVRRNGLEPPYRIEAGLPLLLPVDAVAVPAGPAPEGSVPQAAQAAATPAVTGAAPPGGGSDAPAVSDAPSVSAAPAIVRSERSHADLRDDALRTLAVALVGVRLQPPDDGFAWPLDGSPRITSRFGWRAISVAGNRYHLGLDLGAPTGTPVRAVRDGVVARTGWIGAYGYAVYVRHDDGYETRYAHLSRIDVREGDAVVRGAILGRVGSTGASTGPHLHLEVRRDGRAMDPLLVLPEAARDASRTN